MQTPDATQIGVILIMPPLKLPAWKDGDVMMMVMVMMIQATMMTMLVMLLVRPKRRGGGGEGTMDGK